MTLLLIARATVVLLAGLAAYALAARQSAALRHALLVTTIAVVLALPFASPIAERSMPLRVHAGAAPVRTLVTRLAAQGVPIVDAPQRSATAQRAALAIWLAGVALFSLRLALAWRGALRLRLGERTEWQGRQVLISDAIATPLTIGLIRPTIILPRTLHDRDAALLHEAAHIARGDAWTRLLIELACAIWWFHPLMWLASRRALLEQERACDDAAIAAGAPPIEYAELLVSMASRERRISALPMAAAQQLEARLHAVVDERRSRRGLTRSAFAAALLFGAALLLTMSSITIVAAPLLAEYDAPWSEELPDVALVAPSSVPSSEIAFVEVLRQAASRPKQWRGDLVAQRARWALSRAHGGSLTAALRQSLDDDDWRVRAYAAWSLGVAKDRNAVPQLVTLTRDPVWRMRAMATHALAEIDDDRAAAEMEQALNDSAWQVRLEAAGYFGARSDAHSRGLVTTMLRDEHVAVRTTAQEAVGRF